MTKIADGYRQMWKYKESRDNIGQQEKRWPQYSRNLMAAKIFAGIMEKDNFKERFENEKAFWRSMGSFPKTKVLS